MRPRAALTAAVAAADIPAVSVQQMREVDRIMVEDLGIGLLQMMRTLVVRLPAGPG